MKMAVTLIGANGCFANRSSGRGSSVTGRCRTSNGIWSGNVCAPRRPLAQNRADAARREGRRHEAHRGPSWSRMREGRPRMRMRTTAILPPPLHHSNIDPPILHLLHRRDKLDAE